MNENSHRTNKRTLFISLSLVIATMILVAPLIYSPVAAVALPPSPAGLNFRAAGGWGKTIDLAPIAGNYASYIQSMFGVTLPSIPQDVHAWVYTVYINWSNSQTFYAGFLNFTSSATNFTMPEQLLIQHFTTPNGNDAMFATSFTMLAIFNETNSAVYGSFTLGQEGNLSILRGYDHDIPNPPTSKASIVPLAPSSDNYTWNWGMKYQNLTTLWWRMFFSNGSYVARPFAVMIFDELTFNYHLVIAPPSSNQIGNITTRADYTIGNVSHLGVAEYGPSGTIIGVNQPPIHSYLENMKISILQHQRASVYGKPVSIGSNGVNVRNASVDVSNSKISGKVGDEVIYSTDFSRKLNYVLYSTPGGTSLTTATKTYPFNGIVDNKIFSTNLVYALLHRIASYVPQFFDPKGRGFDVTMADADAIYMITYPQWGGYKIVHDPYFAVFTGTQAGAGGALAVPLLVVGIAALVIVTPFIAIRMKHRTRKL